MGMASVNQTRPHCVNQMGKTHSKFLAARHGRGMYVSIGLNGAGQVSTAGCREKGSLLADNF